jgi:hypothetical protein
MSERINRDNTLQSRFLRPGDETPAVPASVLIQTLEGAQRAIWLIALATKDKDVTSRARIPSDIEQRYHSKCEVPETGSLPAFVLPGEDQEVKRIFHLESIGPLDLSPLEISEVEHRGVRLRLREPLHLQPRLGVENPHFVTVEDTHFGLDAFAGTVSELVDEVAESLVAGWPSLLKEMARHLRVSTSRLLEPIDWPVGQGAYEKFLSEGDYL